MNPAINCRANTFRPLRDWAAGGTKARIYPAGSLFLAREGGRAKPTHLWVGLGAKADSPVPLGGRQKGFSGVGWGIRLFGRGEFRFCSALLALCLLGAHGLPWIPSPCWFKGRLRGQRFWRKPAISKRLPAGCRARPASRRGRTRLPHPAPLPGPPGGGGPPVRRFDLAPETGFPAATERIARSCSRVPLRIAKSLQTHSSRAAQVQAAHANMSAGTQIREILDHIGVNSEPPHLSPARGPPL